MGRCSVDADRCRGRAGARECGSHGEVRTMTTDRLMDLPITPHDFVGQIMDPALDLLPARMGSIEARVMLLSIALQESGLAHRWQVVDLARPQAKGPARGLLQFERGGGVRGVLTHPASRDYAADVCLAR